MNRILEISAEDQLAVVEPGVINSDLNAALEPSRPVLRARPREQGRSRPSAATSPPTRAACCAPSTASRGRLCSLLDVVLADGRLLRTGHRTVKGVTGYDLTALFVGSEGTLGVIVGATVRLRPSASGEPVTLGGDSSPTCGGSARPPARMTAAAPAARRSWNCSTPRRSSASRPTSARDASRRLRRDRGSGLLLVQFDGPTAAADARLRPSSSPSPAARCASRPTPTRANGCSPSAAPSTRPWQSGGACSIEDVAVPRSRMPEMFAAIERISARYGIPIPTVAHAGDGNLHPNFVYTGRTIVPDAVWDAASDLFRAAIELGGTLTGEHGVGVLKRRWLAEELGPDSYELQVKLKSVFDPLGILNPGKVFGGP